MKLKIQENPNYFKDSKSKAIINANVAEYNKYIENKNIKTDIEILKSDFKELTTDINTIKDTLNLILNKLEK